MTPAARGRLPRHYFHYATIFLLSHPAFSQTTQQVQAIQKHLDAQRTSCPGDPPANLGSFDCSFTKGARLEQFVAGSLTDQALLGATFFGTIAHLQQDPHEWKQDWGGLGYRVGTRYAQNLAKGVTEFTAGIIMQTDPRHVTYLSDPGTYHKFDAQRDRCEVEAELPNKQPGHGVGPRIGHVFLDWLTVRRSSPCAAGRRLPNLPLLAGAAASGFVGNAWYPDRLATPGQAGIRAGYSLGTALAASFYTEFQPDLGRLLGAMFKQGQTKKAKP
jgi:hypothetical protein